MHNLLPSLLPSLLPILLPGIIMILLDFIYLNANRRMFEDQVVQIQRTSLQPKILPMVVCYLLLIFGLYYFIIRQHRPVWDAFLLGLVIYGVYELTNYSILKKWNIQMVVLDTVWGGVLFALTTWLTYNLHHLLI